MSQFPARNQGTCGSCTFFAAASMMTFKYWREVYRRGYDHSTANLPLLSAMGMVGCGRLPRKGDGAPTHPGEGWFTYDGGCCGASIDRTLEYIIDHGITSEACYPYTADATPCVACARARGVNVAHPVCRSTCVPEYASAHSLNPDSPYRVVRAMRPSLPDTVYADYSDLQLSDPLVGVRRFKGEANIARAIMRYGAVTCSMALKQGFMTYGSIFWRDGIYYGRSMSSTATPEDIEDMNATVPSHSVACYGFGTTPAGVRYWDCINSWGATWGAGGNGRFKIARGDTHSRYGVGDMDGDHLQAHGCYDVELNTADVHTSLLNHAPPHSPPPPPEVRSPPGPPSRYQEVHSGTCASHGLVEISSVEQCRAALADPSFVLGSANMSGLPPSFPLSPNTITRDPHVSPPVWRSDVPNGCSIKPIRYSGRATWSFTVSWQESGGCTGDRCGCGTYMPRWGDPGYNSSMSNQDLSGNICICDRGAPPGAAPAVVAPPPSMPPPVSPCADVNIVVVPNFNEDLPGGSCPDCGYCAYCGGWVVDGTFTGRGFESDIGLFTERTPMINSGGYRCGEDVHNPGTYLDPPTEPLSVLSRGLVSGPYNCDGIPHMFPNAVVHGVQRTIYNHPTQFLAYGRHMTMLIDS